MTCFCTAALTQIYCLLLNDVFYGNGFAVGINWEWKRTGGTWGRLWDSGRSCTLIWMLCIVLLLETV